jgi:hypothetical protein
MDELYEYLMNNSRDIDEDISVFLDEHLWEILDEKNIR